MSEYQRRKREHYAVNKQAEQLAKYQPEYTAFDPNRDPATGTVDNPLPMLRELPKPVDFKARAFGV